MLYPFLLQVLLTFLSLFSDLTIGFIPILYNDLDLYYIR